MADIFILSVLALAFLYLFSQAFYKLFLMFYYEYYPAGKSYILIAFSEGVSVKTTVSY